MRNQQTLPIRTIRRQLNLSGVEVARKLNITPQYYYDIEKGDRGINGRILVELSKTLGVSTDLLLGKSEEITNNGYSNFGLRLRRMRDKRGLSQEDIATKLGMNRVSYSHYETGKNIPPSNKLREIAILLNVSADYLLGLNFDNTESTNETITSLEQQVKNLKEAIKNLVNGW